MTLDLIVMICQLACVFFLAAWLTTGVLENIMYPYINSTFTSQVLDMTMLRENFPEAYAIVAHRRVSNPRLQIWLFRLIVAWESLATIALWIGTVALAMALAGTTLPETARALALLGVLLFTATWAGFLIAGNWFCYWFCHDGAQNTHYQMTLWGLGTMIFLVVA